MNPRTKWNNSIIHLTQYSSWYISKIIEAIEKCSLARGQSCFLPNSLESHFIKDTSSRAISNLGEGIQELTPSAWETALTSQIPLSYQTCPAQYDACVCSLQNLTNHLTAFLFPSLPPNIGHYHASFLWTMLWCPFEKSSSTWSMNARGKFKRQMSSFSSPNMWFAAKLDHRLWSGCQKNAGAEGLLKLTDQRENLCLMSIQRGLIKVTFACRLSKRTRPMGSLFVWVCVSSLFGSPISCSQFCSRQCLVSEAAFFPSFLSVS